MRKIRADLHIHTCLSPCGDLDMTPRAIVREARRLGLDVIAICDHNSSENIPYVIKIASEGGPEIIPGMEVCTEEEAHLLALFPDLKSLSLFQDRIYEKLQLGENDEKAFGYQVVVNEFDEVMEFNKRLLLGSVSLSLREVVSAVHELAGLAVASHVDREAFSIIGQLGFIPDDLNLDAVEISSYFPIRKAVFQLHLSPDLPIIRSSDAHNLSQLGQSVTEFWMESGTVAE
ncbi:MAG: PHP domain-containing protein, partial [Candidatus Tectomicrobia bacterium]|nr:PHP domain-containing protein [Candidatus Tectomicrobia bacterium]